MSRSALAVALGLVALILALAPLRTGRSDLQLIGEFMSSLAPAVLWNLLAGSSGLVWVGQQAFVGLGGYTLFIGVIRFGMPPLAMIPIAAVTAGLAASVFAPLLFRLEGAYFAMGTRVAAETVALIIAAIPSLGAGAGISMPTKAVAGIAASKESHEVIVYWLTLAAGPGVLDGTYALIRSKAGLALMALRDNRVAARSLGVDIWSTRFRTCLGAAAATGAAGALIFLQKVRIWPDAGFSLNDRPAIVIFIVVIGGIGQIEGTVVGTGVHFVLRESLVRFGPLYLIEPGLVGIGMRIFSRNGPWP
jgi:branched-chain amino acid transport system permease protein